MPVISEYNNVMDKIVAQRSRWGTGYTQVTKQSSGSIMTAVDMNNLRTWIQDLMNRCPAGEPALPGAVSAGNLIQNIFAGLNASIDAVVSCHSNCHSNCHDNCQQSYGKYNTD